jgi:hypothetical protein
MEMGRVTDRDELADLIYKPPADQRSIGAAHYRQRALECADAILARWRLVPVEDLCPDCAGREQRPHRRSYGPDQHRAADEPTRHVRLPLVPCDTCTAECTCQAQPDLD